MSTFIVHNFKPYKVKDMYAVAFKGKDNNITQRKMNWQFTFYSSLEGLKQGLRELFASSRLQVAFNCKNREDAISMALNTMGSTEQFNKITLKSEFKDIFLNIFPDEILEGKDTEILKVKKEDVLDPYGEEGDTTTIYKIEVKNNIKFAQKYGSGMAIVYAEKGIRNTVSNEFSKRNIEIKLETLVNHFDSLVQRTIKLKFTDHYRFKTAYLFKGVNTEVMALKKRRNSNKGRRVFEKELNKVVTVYLYKNELKYFQNKEMTVA